MKKRATTIGLWRDVPVICPIGIDGIKFSTDFLFPSGRQALSSSLQKAGLTREDRVAIPEWSSHCVISAVGRVSTPIPINEVIKYKINVNAVLIYEQWGWPLSADVRERLCEYFKGKIFLRDMVDSAHYEINENSDVSDFKTYIRIISLSKVLGLKSGGLAVFNSGFLAFNPNDESMKLLNIVEKNDLIHSVDDNLVSNIMKSDIAAISRELENWLDQNDLSNAMEVERIARHENIKKILKSPLADKWPIWMREAVENGARPGIAPLLRDYSNDILNRTKKFLMDSYKIETCIYNFNWSGNPLNPDYKECLAFPVHGMVSNIEDILEDLKLQLK